MHLCIVTCVEINSWTIIDKKKNGVKFFGFFFFFFVFLAKENNSRDSYQFKVQDTSLEKISTMKTKSWIPIINDVLISNQ